VEKNDCRVQESAFSLLIITVPKTIVDFDFINVVLCMESMNVS
jgi:hypothetical protein